MQDSALSVNLRPAHADPTQLSPQAVSFGFSIHPKRLYNQNIQFNHQQAHMQKLLKLSKSL
jgi:hypothetical protein